MGHLGPSWCHPGARFIWGLGASGGSFFGQLLFWFSWGLLGSSWSGPRVLLGHPGAILESSWGHSGSACYMGIGSVRWVLFWTLMVLVLLGLSWAILGPSWRHLGAVLGPSWAILGSSWAILGPSWSYPGLIGGCLGPSWGHPGHILVPSWPILGPF